MEAVLEAKDVSKYFGAFTAVKNLNFSVKRGEIFGIAGPNGAGKSTLFNVITAVPYNASSGQIVFEGEEIQQLRAHEICQRGIARTFQVPEVFKNLTFLQNVEVGAAFKRQRTLRSVLRLENSERRAALAALETVGLVDKSRYQGKTASLFEMKRLMLASAVAVEPRLILMDEPFAGLNKSEIEETKELLSRVNERGVTIMLVEHVMTALMSLSNRVMMLHHGEKISEGSPEEVASDKVVIEAYLGKEYQPSRMVKSSA